MSSAMRMCIIGLVLVVGLSAAAGFREACPAWPTGLTTEFYEYGNCTVADTCGALACQCISGTAVCTEDTVLAGECAKSTLCIAKYNLCLVDAASKIAGDLASASPVCAAWATPFHAKQLEAAGATYAGSVAQAACKAFSCGMMNMTTTPVSCSNDTASYDDMCFLPSAAPVTALSLEILGNWSFLNNGNMTQKNEVIAALERDLALHFGFPVTITNVTVSATGVMNVAFTVFSLRGPIEAKIASLPTAALAAVKAIFTAITGNSASTIGPGTVVDPTAPTTEEPMTTTTEPSATSSNGGGDGDGDGASTAATLMSVAVAALVAVLAL